MRSTSASLLLFLALTLLAACGESTDQQTGQAPGEPSAAGETMPDVREERAFEGKTDVTRVDPQTSTAATLTDLRIAAREGYDRIVFELEGDDPPGYIITYVDEATQCGSGHVVPVEGNAILRVQLAPARAHEFIEERREPTLEADEFHEGLDSIGHVVMICDHHGGVEWAIGLPDTLEYRASSLTSPTRIVVDILHP